MLVLNNYHLILMIKILINGKLIWKKELLPTMLKIKANANTKIKKSCIMIVTEVDFIMNEKTEKEDLRKEALSK